MISNCCRFCISLLLLLLIFSCGKIDESVSIVLSGTVSGPGVTQYPDKPILVAVAKNSNGEQYGLNSFDNLMKLVFVDKSDFSFEFDLNDTELRPGDVINLIAFVDVNFTGDVPNPDAGDYIGLYTDEQSYSEAYTLQSGVNGDFEIHLNRVISPHKTRISGTVTESPPGDLIIVAYAGEIDNLGFSEFNPDGIIAYTRLKKEASALPYQLDILAYPYDLKADYFYVLAFLDEDGSGIPAPGNIVGFHTNQIDAMPELIQRDTSKEVHLSAVDIQMRFSTSDSQESSEIRIPEPSGDTISLAGEFDLPEVFDPDEGELFVLVTQTDSLYDLADTPMTAVRYFQKMPKGENRFSLDLSNTGLFLTDEVMVMALWDRDYRGGFPKPTQGDMVGLLQQTEELSHSILLSQWQDTTELPPEWEFSLNRVFYDHQATVQFEINKEAPIVPQKEDPLIAVAVAREGINLFDQTIDTDYILGMANVITGRDGPPYTLKIFPAIHGGSTVWTDPFTIKNVYILVVLDNSPANGLPDPGEYIGYYGPNVPFTEAYIPFSVDIEDKKNLLHNPISFIGVTY